ncbi:MAG: nucleotide exchange factor GrpE [Gammaproteobacteria bacterium]
MTKEENLQSDDVENTSPEDQPEGADATAETVASVQADAEPTVESLTTALEEARAESHSNWERCLRTAAELDNVRKRAARDVENANKFALERFARELLGVRDSLEMGIAAAADKPELAVHVEGSSMTLKTFDQVLEKFGVVTIDPAGEKFDPALHEAMAARPEEGVESGIVLDVVQKGFELNGRLLRAARVFVAQ